MDPPVSLGREGFYSNDFIDMDRVRGPLKAAFIKAGTDVVDIYRHMDPAVREYITYNEVHEWFNGRGFALAPKAKLGTFLHSAIEHIQQMDAQP